MAIKPIPKRLTAAPGKGVKDILDSTMKVLKGPTISAGTAGTAMNTVVDVFQIRPGMRIFEIILENTTKWTTGAGVVTKLALGDSDNASRYFSSDVWTVTAGIKRMTSGFGFKPASSDPVKIQATITTTSDIDGGVTVPYLVYAEEVN